MFARLLGLTERTAARLRRANLDAGTVQIKVRRADFTTYTRQAALGAPGSDTAQLYAVARRLLAGWCTDHPGAPVRLLGVGATRLVRASQGDLFDTPDETRPRSVDAAVDSIRERFPDTTIGRARGLRRN